VAQKSASELRSKHQAEAEEEQVCDGDDHAQHIQDGGKCGGPF
jgi:hypothetical protein